jgi:hypothetical protein
MMKNRRRTLRLLHQLPLRLLMSLLNQLRR